MSAPATTWRDLGIDIPSGRSGEIDVPCPMCSHTRKKAQAKCLSVNTRDAVWFCNHCSWSGSLHSGQDRGSNPTYHAPAETRPKVYTTPNPPPPAEVGLTPPVLAYFAKRGISETTLRRRGITAGPIWMPQVEEVVNAIQFPYVRNGAVVNIKYRDGQKNFRMVAGAERILYGLDDALAAVAAGASRLVIVEGEADALSLVEAGIDAVVSVPDGAPSPEAKSYASKFTFLDDDAALRLLEAVDDVVLAVDADAPGITLAEELARRIGPERCYRVAWPDGCKDANETLVAHGPAALTRCVAEAVPEPVAGIVTVRDLVGKLDLLYEHGLTGGVTTGWPSLTRHYRPRAGMMTVVTGAPSAGKSVFLNALLVDLATMHGWTFGVCSPEFQPLELHASRLMACYAGKPFGAGPTERMSRDEMVAARDWLDRNFAFVLPDEPSVDAVLERARILVLRMGITGLVIDPWSEMDHTRPHGMTGAEFVNDSLRKVRSFARNHDCHVWFVAHPTKQTKTEDGTYPVVTPYDISDGAGWYNKADTVLSVWRDRRATDNLVQVHVQKVRFAETGAVGMVELRHDPVTGRYYDMGRNGNGDGPYAR